MRINGVWVGWGLGDNSAGDFTVRNFKAFARRMYRSYMGHLADTNLFDQQLYDALVIMQDKLVAGGQLRVGGFIRGVLDLETQYATTFKKRTPAPRVLPIVFTQEGHQSNMFFGPCAQTAGELEREGFCHWKPIGDWNTTKIPFDRSGVEAWRRQLGANAIEGPPVDLNNPDGPKVMWPFPPGTPWGGIGFSRGAKDFCDFMDQYVIPVNAPLHYRLKDFRRGLAFGNPRRAKDAICAWALDPPDAGTHGIMDVLFDANAKGIGDRWAENANDDDMFAEVGDDRAGKYQTAIAKIITEGKFFGGTATIVPQVLAMLGNIPASLFGAVMAAIDAIAFLARNPNPHYSTFATGPDVDWMRGVR